MIKHINIVSTISYTIQTYFIVSIVTMLACLFVCSYPLLFCLYFDNIRRRKTFFSKAKLIPFRKKKSNRPLSLFGRSKYYINDCSQKVIVLLNGPFITKRRLQIYQSKPFTASKLFVVFQLGTYLFGNNV
jgi:hypothetical protein